MIFFLVIPTIQQGGAERVISELANEFSKYPSVIVHLILLADANDFYEVDDRVIVHRLGFGNINRIGKIKSEIATFLKMRSLLKIYKPTAVLSFMEKYNVFTLLTGSFLGLEIFVSDRSNPLKEVPLSINLLRRLTYKHASGIIAQTSLAKDILSKQTKNTNIKVIPNPVKEVQLFPEISREKVIINVGRMVPEKGQDYLLQAFAKLDTTDWKLAILGDGPLRNNLEKRIIELGLTDKVIMPGAVNDIDRWLAKSSIFVLSSISEGFPNSLMEAMAAGLPCISFDCNAGPRDIITNEVNGLLVERGNINELVNKLNALITDAESAKALATNALLVRDKYHIRSIGNNYLNFLLKK